MCIEERKSEELKTERKFKVGDKVTVSGSDVSIYSGNGTIVECKGYKINGYKISSGKYTGSNVYEIKFDKTGVRQTIEEPYIKNIPPSSITIDNKVYTALKSLSPESIYANGKYSGCSVWENEFDEYCDKFHFYKEPDFKDFIEEVCPNHPSWLPWLIKNGYVKVEDVKRKLKPTFEIRVGDKFAVDLGYGDKGYILAGLSCNRYALVDMQTGVTMNSIIEGELNLETFKNLCGFFNWEKVYSTRIPYKA